MGSEVNRIYCWTMILIFIIITNNLSNNHKGWIYEIKSLCLRSRSVGTRICFLHLHGARSRYRMWIHLLIGNERFPKQKVAYLSQNLETKSSLLSPLLDKKKKRSNLTKKANISLLFQTKEKWFLTVAISAH